MSSLPLKHRLSLAVLALGAYAQVAQALLVREGLVVFYGNEVSLGAFFGSWLLWIAIGSAGVIRFRNRAWARDPLPTVRLLTLLMPWLLVLQIALARTLRIFLDVSAGEFIPLGQLLLAALVVNLPTGLAVGSAFPLTCKALARLSAAESVSSDETGTRQAVGHVSLVYVYDALGALLGGLVFTFVLIEWLGVWRSIGFVAALLAATAAALAPESRPLKATALAVVVLGLGVGATPLGQVIEDGMERLRFATLQPGLELLEAVETRYGHMALARLGTQFSVVTDGRIAESFPTPRKVAREAAYFYAQADGARRVLLFGGLAGGLAAELLRYPVERLEVVEQDRAAFERIRPYLPEATQAALADPRLEVHFEDGRRFAHRLTGDEAYDLVLVVAADPASAHSNRFFTLEFYARMGAAMAPTGVLCTAVSSASNYLGRDVKSYSGSVFTTLGRVFPHRAILPGDRHVYCASASAGRVSEDPRVLERRYRAIPLDEHRFPALSFHSLLPAERVAFVRQQLEAEVGALNTDARPVTYYLNMVLWGKFTASGFVDWLHTLRDLGPWPYLVPLVVLTALGVLRAGLEAPPRPRLRRRSAGLTLVLLGMIAMAVQLTLLFSYQGHVGFVFGRIALLNGVFMAGLALGAGALGQRLTRAGRPALALGGVMMLVGLCLVGLPTLLDAIGALDGPAQEVIYLLLCTAAGLLTGTGFPLGVHLAQVDTREVIHSSALMEAADDLGGALGGLLSGALLVPLLGIAGTSYLLASFAAMSLIPLGYAELAPASIPLLHKRGYRAFPYPRLSWALAFAVLTVFACAMLWQRSAPAPTLDFDEGTLTAVSGSRTFERRDTPMPHYIGSGQGETAEPGSRGASLRTVSLATMAVASDVRGHAGPINLLVSVDERGTLRGVRYLHSRETPSYITGIEAWLGALAGRELAEAPLRLEDVDALSGATVTSRAALQSINRAAAAGLAAAFDQRLATTPEAQAPPRPWQSPRFIAVLVLLAAFFPTYRSGRDGPRLVYQAATLLVLGFGLNSLVTEVDVVNLSRGHLPSFASEPHWYLLLGFVAVTAVLFGQAYCGYVCPFGALQEFISRLGRFLYLRGYVERDLDRRMRYVKFVLLAGLLCAVWLTQDITWGSFNPMQHVFAGHWSGWIGAMIGLSLFGALLYYRFWCRYLCPFGALLALSNKLALLKRWGPARRFEHCDLGVRDEYDVDCIQCHRCVSARDFGVRVRKH
jgi:spermidine synthase